MQFHIYLARALTLALALKIKMINSYTPIPTILKTTVEDANKSQYGMTHGNNIPSSIENHELSLPWPKMVTPTDTFMTDSAHKEWAKFLVKNGLLSSEIYKHMVKNKNWKYYLSYNFIAPVDIAVENIVRPWIEHNGGNLLHMHNQITYNVHGLGKVRHRFNTMVPPEDHTIIKLTYGHSFKLVSVDSTNDDMIWS